MNKGNTYNKHMPVLINASSILYEGGKTLDKIIYPIGSVYISINSTDPHELFGGTWVQIKDAFLLACGDVYSNGSTGGEATHQLTVNEMPAHKHNVATVYPFAFGGLRTAVANSSSSDRTGTAYDVVDSTGGGQSHNNMPPYLAVYMWKRIS